VAQSRRPRFVLIFLAYAAKLSGGDRHLLEMAARWREHVDVSVVAPPRALPTVSGFLGDVHVHQLGSSPPIGPRLAFEYFRRSVVVLTRPLPRADVALAASHFTPDAAALASLSRRGALGVGYVYHLLAARAKSDARTLWSKNDERIGLAILKRYADLLFVSNDGTGAVLSERGFHPVKTEVGIDLERFTGDEDRVRSPNRGLFIGRLVDSKGVRDAIQAWAQVQAAIPDAKLIMVGEGPQQDIGKALACRLGLASAVDFVGFVSEEEKRRLLLESSVLLAPSYEEGWGIAVGEALASRIPVVAYQLPVLDELFPSSYFAAPVGDHAKVADIAVRVLTDPSFAGSVVQTAAETVSRYDLDHVAADELETILRRQASQSRIRPTRDAGE
jgi:glycosyltransferase involved in cell wall biosynthesis